MSFDAVRRLLSEASIRPSALWKYAISDPGGPAGLYKPAVSCSFSSSLQPLLSYMPPHLLVDIPFLASRLLADVGESGSQLTSYKVEGSEISFIAWWRSGRVWSYFITFGLPFSLSVFGPVETLRKKCLYGCCVLYIEPNLRCSA